MANTYIQISIHAKFVVKHRENIITKEWRNRLHSYIAGILKNEEAKPLAVGGWLDHVHIFFALPPTKSIYDVMRIAKASSSKWINESNFVKGKFQWQEACLPVGRAMLLFPMLEASAILSLTTS